MILVLHRMAASELDLDLISKNPLGVNLHIALCLELRASSLELGNIAETARPNHQVPPVRSPLPKKALLVVLYEKFHGFDTAVARGAVGRSQMKAAGSPVGTCLTSPFSKLQDTPECSIVVGLRAP